MADPPDSVSKARIPLELLKTNLAFSKRLFTSHSRRAKGKGSYSYRRDVAYATIRALLAGLGTVQVQYITVTTDKMYALVTKRKGAIARSVTLGDAAQGHWIGNNQAHNVMLYFHGGGFYGAATIGHIRYLYTLQSEISKLGHDFAIFVLTYTLSPGGVYPMQLKQAALALNYLLTDEHRDPSTILLGGDSAGGNLAAALLQHIARPHPEVPRVALSRPLHSALLISPWVSFKTNTPSFDSNSESDYIPARALRRAATTYMGPGENDAYSEPAKALPEWWTDVANLAVRNVIIWAGGGEVLLDGIRAFADNIKNGFEKADPEGEDGNVTEKRPPRFLFTVTPKSAHEEMIIEELTFGWAKGDAAREVEQLLSAVLKRESQ